MSEATTKPSNHFKDTIFDVIKAEKFFQRYAPAVSNWKHKLRGKSGRGEDLDFTKDDIASIKFGLKQVGIHLLASDFTIMSAPKKVKAK